MSDRPEDVVSRSAGGENHREGAGSKEHCTCDDHTTLYDRAVDGIYDRSPRVGGAIDWAENKVLAAFSSVLQALSAAGFWAVLALAASIYLVLRG